MFEKKIFISTLFLHTLQVKYFMFYLIYAFGVCPTFTFDTLHPIFVKWLSAASLSSSLPFDDQHLWGETEPWQSRRSTESQLRWAWKADLIKQKKIYYNFLVCKEI